MLKPLALLGTVVRAELFMTAVIIAGVGGVAVWVTPMAIEAMTPEPEPLGVVRVEGAMPEDRAEVISGLRQTLESCFALVGVEHDALVLWESDTHDHGVINMDEVLVVSHSESLRTLSASFAGSDAGGAELDPSDLVSARGLRRFRTSTSSTSRVIATGVSDVSVATSPGAPGEAEVLLTLTWLSPEDDALAEAGASRTTLRVRLRRIEGLGR